MTNIELFDEYTARILAEAYRSFPVKIGIDARTLCGHDDVDEYGRVADPSGRPSKQFEIAHATLAWLRDTGYLRGEIYQFGMLEIVLTAQGLAVLKAVPESLQGGESTGDKLARLVGEGSFDIAKDLVKTAITAGAKMIAAS